MKSKIVITLLCGILLLDIQKTHGFVRRDVEHATPSPNLVDSFQHHVDQFRNCIDQSMASAVSEVNEKQLQPLFSALGDQLNRFSKAFDALTAPSATGTTGPK